MFFIFFFFKPLVESSLLLAAVSFSISISKSIDLTLFHAFGRIFFLLAAFSLHTFNQESIDLKLFQVFRLPYCFLPFPWSFYFFCGPPSPSHDFITLLFNFLACFSSQHWALKQFLATLSWFCIFFVKLRMWWDTRILTWAFFVPFYPADLSILTSFGKGWPHSKFQSDAIYIYIWATAFIILEWKNDIAHRLDMSNCMKWRGGTPCIFFTGPT